MNDLSDLIARARRGFGTAAGRAAQVEAYENLARECAAALAALVKREAELERAVRMAFDDAKIATAACEAENNALQARMKRLEDALRWIAWVNAMDYEYQNKARDALAEGDKP